MRTLTSLLIFISASIGYAAEKPTQTEIRSNIITDIRLEQASQRIQEAQRKERDVAGKILVLGQVAKPGFYKFDEPTFDKAIDAASGPGRLGSLTHFYILSGGRLTEYFAPQRKKTPASLQVEPGDAIFLEYQCTAFGASVLTEAVANN